MSPLAALEDLTVRLGRFIDKAGPAAPAGGEFGILALELFARQYAAVPSYRRLCDRWGATPETVASWRDLPAIPTAAFRDFDLTSLPPERRHRVFHSSGTTGLAASRHFHSAESLDLYERSLRPWFARHLLAGAASPHRRWRFVALSPDPAAAPHSSLVHMIATAASSAGDPAPCYLARVRPDASWELDFVRAEAMLAAPASPDQALCLLGPAFAFVHLLDHLDTRNAVWPLPADSRLMETGGYKGRSRTVPRAELYDRLEHRLRVPLTHVVGEYGMTELGSQAYDRIAGPDSPASAAPADRCFRFPAWARALVVSPENGREVAPGQTGLLRVFDLANARSVLAIQTEDLARRLPGGFQLLGRANAAPARGCSLALANPS
jgi:hypothetical protein